MLLSQTAYNNRGEGYLSTDPAGMVTRTDTDNAGRTIRTDPELRSVLSSPGRRMPG